MLSEDNEKNHAKKASKIIDSLSAFVESRKGTILIGICFLYIGIPLYLSSQKLLWNDELYTLYFSRLPAWPDLWRALNTGADQIPPTFVLLTKLCVKIFGENRISLRLPEVAGFSLMGLSLYRIVSIRTSAICGFLAMLFPTMTAALAYAYEARGYALVLGFSAFAFYCWQLAAQPDRKKIHLIGLGIGLSGSLLSHYYGVFLYFPIVLGEVSRFRTFKKIDYAIWITFLISLVPLLIFLPLIQASATYGGSFWARPQWLDLLLFYGFLLTPVGVLLVFVLILLAFFSMLKSPEQRFETKAIRPYEWVAALGFVVLPAISIVMAKLTNVGLTGRHVLLSIVGFGILVPCSIYHAFESRKLLTIAMLSFLLGFIGNALSNLNNLRGDVASFERTVAFLQTNADERLPIVSWFAHPAQQVWYYGPNSLADRFFYLASPEASNRYLGHDTVDRGLIDLRTWFPIKNAQPYKLFTTSHNQFLLYYCAWEEDWRWNWIVSSLLSDHMRIELKARQGEQYLFSIAPRTSN